MRIGYRMRELTDVVSACPGISKRAALRAVGLPERGLGSGREMMRAIRAGLIVVELECPWVRRSAHALFASERDRQMFHLCAELLHGSPTPERAAELAAEIDELRQAQAADYAKESA
jgi:hypothetical protein